MKLKPKLKPIRVNVPKKEFIRKTFSLYPGTIEKIEEIAETSNMKYTHVIEYSINQLYESLKKAE